MPNNNEVKRYETTIGKCSHTPRKQQSTTVACFALMLIDTDGENRTMLLFYPAACECVIHAFATVLPVVFVTLN